MPLDQKRAYSHLFIILVILHNELFVIKKAIKDFDPQWLYF